MLQGVSEEDHSSPIRPLLEGDDFHGQQVAGFAWMSPGVDVRSTHLDDRLLLKGDEDLPAPPDRPAPQMAESSIAAGFVPPNDLPGRQIVAADSIGPTIPLRADALLDLPGAVWQPLARTLFASVHATGHRIWLAGGAARDVIAEVPARDINDLDLTGTVPAGRFTDITYQCLRASRMSEFRTTITPRSLVCAVIPPRSNARLIEYRGLSRGGFRFPAVGSRLAEDARHRDFRFNALLYDVLNHTVLDPLGTGLADLRGEPRCFHPMSRPTDPYGQAMILLRAMKFALRWRHLPEPDLEPLCAWVAGLPPDLCQTLTEDQWNSVISTCERSVDAPVPDLMTFAARLPQPGRGLLETTIGRLK
jgi:poly(A) polymerase